MSMTLPIDPFAPAAAAPSLFRIMFVAVDETPSGLLYMAHSAEEALELLVHDIVAGAAPISAEDFSEVWSVQVSGPAILRPGPGAIGFPDHFISVAPDRIEPWRRAIAAGFDPYLEVSPAAENGL